MKFVASMVVGFMIWAAACGGAAIAADDDQAELQAVHDSSQEFVKAFNAADAKAVAALWSENGEYIDEAGERVAGRAAIEQEYAKFFAAHKGATIRLVIESIRLVGAGVAIEDGRATVEPPPEGAPATSRYTAVHVKQDGEWLMASVRDTRVETPSAYHQIADFDWLIGAWTAEEHGATMDATFRWIANKNFIERTYAVTRAGEEIASGVQLIGWNSQLGQIQSWTFASDGAVSVGLWSPTATGWASQSQGLTADGMETTAVNVMTRLDDQAMVWQSVNRMAAGQALPDTEEIVVKRKATK